MYFIDRLKLDLSETINKGFNEKIVSPQDFTVPPDSELGDLALPCFKFAHKFSKSPAQIAEELIDTIKPIKEIECYKAAGPYLNFIIDKRTLYKHVIIEVNTPKKQYGTNTVGQNKKVMVEFSNANTHKEFHVGHLRNLCFGDAINRILSANGYQSMPVSYINDFGVHVAKTLWCYDQYFKNAEVPDNKGYFLGKIYSRAAEELKENEVASRLVGGVMKKIESRKGEEFELWKLTRLWSIEQFASIYEKLDIKFFHTFYESEFIEDGLKMTYKLLEDGVLKKSDGAVIADLEKFGLGVLVVLRSDGTALYPVADLPLAMHKIKKFDLDESIYIVDIRQNLYFRQLFKILELLGFKQNFRHLGYEFVKLPSGMMSSRSGNVITYEELWTALVSNEITETQERHPDWPADKIRNTAETIAKAIIKFEMNKVSAGSIITFDINTAMRFDGFTAAYVLYTYARIQSIIRKADFKPFSSPIDFSLLSNKTERAIILKLAIYPETVKKAGTFLDPSEIAKFIFDFAQILNDYYHDTPILKAENTTLSARLILIHSASLVIKNALELLGIETLEEM